jgi:hypothetical protein
MPTLTRFKETRIRKRCGIVLLPALAVLLSLTSASHSCRHREGAFAAYQEATESIRKRGLQEEGAYEILKKITAPGPRLTGSPQAARAVEITLQLMLDLGLDSVHAETVAVNQWVRGEFEEAAVISGPGETTPLSISALGGSVGTPAQGITAPVFEVTSLDELRSTGGGAEGKIVFFNGPMDRKLADPFAAYGRAADQRVRGAVEGAKAGAAAVLVRSLTMRIDGFPHTGLMLYDPAVAQIPAAAVSTEDAEMLHRMLLENPSLLVRLRLSCRMLEPVTSANVVGDIKGTDFPDQIILLGGHLDSWDLGTGAHDDGAGCAHALEALRLLGEAGLKPRRTIRAVMFMDEEFGGTGGRFYARAEERRGEKHLVAFESDRGGFSPLAIAIGGGPGCLKKLRAYAPLFKPLGIREIIPGGGGVDIAPLIESGTVPAGVILDPQRYFDYHHSARDVASAVHPRELELGAIALAVGAFILAQEGI